jgi:hypothetical protein
VRNWYPFPQIDDLLNQLKGDKYFSKIDLNFIYQQVPIKKTIGWKTSFKSNYDLFEWLVMPFGLMNFPTNFIRVMDDILCHFTNYFVEIYLVDILIFNRIWVEHLQHTFPPRAMLTAIFVSHTYLR